MILKFLKPVVMSILLLTSFLQLTSCGGSTGSSSLSTGDKVLLLLNWSGEAWELVENSVNSSNELTLPFSCPSGGSMEQSGGSIAVNQCAFEAVGITFTEIGTYSMTPQGNDVLHAWSLEIKNNSQNFTSSGNVLIGSTTESFEVTGVFGSDTFVYSGNLTDNGNDTLTATFNITQNGALIFTCNFTNFNPDTATDAEYSQACGI